ncbi:MAG: type II secretion system F family protein [Sedimentisphaerales bacterium]|nr:type II secretion system F family protein [Sedimentisphaerales bacterium]
MPKYQYKAIDRTGRSVQGQIETVSGDEAAKILARQGRFVDEIKPVSEVVSDRKKRVTVLPTKAYKKIKLSEKDRYEFIRQLATALKGKLPILTALAVLNRQNPRPAIRQLAGDLHSIIKSGKSLSYGLSRYPDSFSDLHLSMVEAGQTTGNLDYCMNQMADLIEREVTIRTDILTAALYPAFVLCLGLISVAIVMTWILPQILNTLVADMAVLPWPTRAVLNITSFLESGYGIITFILLLLLFFLLSRWRNTARGRYVIDSMKLRFPIFGDICAKWAYARFSRFLGTLIEGGVTILEALHIVRNSMGNEALGRSVDQIIYQIKNGSSLAHAMHGTSRFGPLLIQIVAVGEETGQLPELLLNAAEAYDRDTHVAIRRFMAVFPAILITLLALIIGFIVAATLMPIVQIETAIPGL